VKICTVLYFFMADSASSISAPILTGTFIFRNTTKASVNQLIMPKIPSLTQTKFHKFSRFSRSVGILLHMHCLTQHQSSLAKFPMFMQHNKSNLTSCRTSDIVPRASILVAFAVVSDCLQTITRCPACSVQSAGYSALTR